MEYRSILSILKYCGILVAAVSSIWGLRTKTTTEDGAGHKRLTPSGHIAIALTIVATIISVFCYGLEGIVKSQADARQREDQRLRDAQQKEEQERLRLDRLEQTQELILASQPLRALTFSIRIQGLSQEQKQAIRQRMDLVNKIVQAAAYEVGDLVEEPRMEYKAAVARAQVLYPLLRSIAQRGSLPTVEAAAKGTIFLIDLDGSGSIVLPLGCTTQGNVAGYVEHLDLADLDIGGQALPTVSATRKLPADCPMINVIIPNQYAYIEVRGEVPAHCLSSVLQHPAESFATAAFPSYLRAVGVNSGEQGLPFSPTDVLRPVQGVRLCWRDTADNYSAEDLELVISVTPNGQRTRTREYRLRKSFTESLSVLPFLHDDPVDYGTCVAFGAPRTRSKSAQPEASTGQ